MIERARRPTYAAPIPDVHYTDDFSLDESSTFRPLYSERFTSAKTSRMQSTTGKWVESDWCSCGRKSRKTFEDEALSLNFVEDLERWWIVLLWLTVEVEFSLSWKTLKGQMDYRVIVSCEYVSPLYGWTCVNMVRQNVNVWLCLCHIKWYLKLCPNVKSDDSVKSVNTLYYRHRLRKVMKNVVLVFSLLF